MTGDEQNEKANKKFAPFDLADEQHKRQRHQCDNPGIDCQHDPDLSGLHTKTLRDV